MLTTSESVPREVASEAPSVSLFQMPRSLSPAALTRLQKNQRKPSASSGDKKGSANRAKARCALAREYEKVSNNRADFAHKFSTSVVQGKNTIACETLNLKGMSRTKLAKSVADAAHRETFRAVGQTERLNAYGANVRPATAGRSR